MSCLVCNLVEYSDSVDKFHAILFHQRSFSLRDKPSTRRPEQRYVHWSFESPVHRYSTVQYSTVQSPVHRFYDKTDLKDLDNFFNWSMTYRLDSDFPVPYGDIQQVEYLPYRRRAMRIIYFLLFSRWSLYLREIN